MVCIVVIIQKSLKLILTFLKSKEKAIGKRKTMSLLLPNYPPPQRDDLDAKVWTEREGPSNRRQVYTINETRFTTYMNL
jgi:hypothetical protein